MKKIVIGSICVIGFIFYGHSVEAKSFQAPDHNMENRDSYEDELSKWSSGSGGSQNKPRPDQSFKP